MKISLAIGSLVLSVGLGAVLGCSGATDSPNAYAGKSTSTDNTDPANQDDGTTDDGTSSSSGSTGSSSGGSSSGSSSSSSGSSSGSTSSSSGSSSGGANDPLNAAAKCTNGTSTSGNNSSMKPGQPCNNCHNFSIAGTVYPSGHEPNNCKGVNVSGYKVVVTDSGNHAYNVTVNSAGNFYSNTYYSFPITVKITDSSGKARPMTTSLDSSMGDCNSCHTQNGSGSPKAPGRITTPF